MKTCPSCSNAIASNAGSCPRCGYRYTHPMTMIAAILAGLVILGLVYVMTIS